MEPDSTFQEHLSLGTRLRHGWNAFKNKDPAVPNSPNEPTYGSGGYMGNPGISVINEILPRRFFQAGVDKTFVTSIYERLATDCSIFTLLHCRVDENKRYLETIHDGLNECLTTEANVDQTGRELLIDTVLTMLDGNGVAAIVPVDTTINPNVTGSYDIQSLRVGTVIDWAPLDVKVQVYNDRTGMREQIWIPKRIVALVTNPFKDVMNTPNSTLRRLTEKLALLDVIDQQSGSGKLDLIIQLPYVTKNKTKVNEANERRKQLEEQLEDSKLGIGYIDATEKIVQLNRSVENNLMAQVEYLTSMLYSQLGLTQEIMNGTADEAAMLNYYNRTINPILNAVVDEMRRKFLTRTARTQGQSICYFRDPFMLTTSDQLAEIADKFTRNEIVSSNEMRSVIGFKPVRDARADELRNKNLNASDQQIADPVIAERTVGNESNEGVAP